MLETTQHQSESTMSVAIIGAAGTWGSHFVRASEQLGMRTLKIEKAHTASDREPEEVLQMAHAIVFAVDGGTVRRILDACKPGSCTGKIIIDIASVKMEIASVLKRHADEGAHVCSTHPMVMGRKIAGHVAHLMPVGKHAEPATELARSLYLQMGMRPEEFDFDKHDEVIVPMQTIDTLLLRLRLALLEQHSLQTGVNMNILERIGSANFLLNQVASGRMALQSPHVSAEIITSPAGQSMLKTLAEAVAALQGKESEALSDRFTQTATALDPSHEWRAHMSNISDAIIRILLEDRNNA
jgi:prephenate dehydrogenase